MLAVLFAEALESAELVVGLVNAVGSIRDGFQNFARDYLLEGFRHR